MAKVTVYVSDDQLEQLKAVKGFGRGGVSKMFQAFLESVTTGGGSAPAGRYDYARKLMPLHAAIETHRRRLARSVSAGGPPADGGPIAAALTVLLYKRLLDQSPDAAASLEKELARFGLDELVATELEGVDLLAEPEEPEEIEDDESEPFEQFLGPLGIRLGNIAGVDVSEALRGVNAIKFGLKDLKHEERAARRAAVRGGRARQRVRSRLVVEVGSDDDPRDILTATDFATFTSRHDDWKPGAKLTPSQMETVRELLITRAGGDPSDEDAQLESEEEILRAAAEADAAASASADEDDE